MRGDFIVVIVEIFLLEVEVNFRRFDFKVKFCFTLIRFREFLIYLDVNLLIYNYFFYRFICVRFL